jgi:hypothetical protein
LHYITIKTVANEFNGLSELICDDYYMNLYDFKEKYKNNEKVEWLSHFEGK